MKLIACDLDDLSVISSLCQDALVAVGDMSFQHDEAQFTAVLNRFRWEHSDRAPPFSRTHAALCFDTVTDVSSQGVARAQQGRILNLLSIAYADNRVVLSFADRVSVRLIVAGLKVRLSDLGEPWPSPWRPDHSRA